MDGAYKAHLATPYLVTLVAYFHIEKYQAVRPLYGLGDAHIGLDHAAIRSMCGRGSFSASSRS